MHIDEAGICLRETGFIVLFEQEGDGSEAPNSTSRATQNFDLVINVSENEFSTEECLDQSSDVGSEDDDWNETLTDDTIFNVTESSGANGCIPNGCIQKCASNTSPTAGQGFHLSVSGKRPYDSDTSDEEFVAKKARCRFTRESEPITFPNPVRLDCGKVGECLDGVAPGITEGLELSDFSITFSQSPEDGRKNLVEESAANSHVDGQLPTSPPCLLPNVALDSEAGSASTTPAHNVLKRLGPKVLPCERIVLISEPREVPTDPGDLVLLEEHSDGLCEESEVLSDQCHSPSAVRSPCSSHGAYENSPTSVLDQPEEAYEDSPADQAEKSPNSLPEIQLKVNLIDSVKGEVSKDSQTKSAAVPTVCKPFISDDPDENKDNSDPNWTNICSLNTDNERYQAVRQRWQNTTIPKLHRNLTLQNYRKRYESCRGVTNVNVLNGRNKRKRPFDMEGPRAKRLRCSSDASLTTLFREKIDNAQQVCRKREQEITFRFHNELQNYGESPRYLEAIQNNRNYYHRMATKLCEARDEIIIVQKFYCGLKNSPKVSNNANALSRHQVMELQEQDIAYSQYDLYYR